MENFKIGKIYEIYYIFIQKSILKYSKIIKIKIFLVEIKINNFINIKFLN